MAGVVCSSIVEHFPSAQEAWVQSRWPYKIITTITTIIIPTTVSVGKRQPRIEISKHM